MKKSLTILTIAILAIMTFAGFVNAASVTVSPTNVQKVEAGETVSVTVNFAACKGYTFDLTYDSASFTYVSATKGASVNDEVPGTLSIGQIDASGSLTSVQITFRTLKAIDATQAFSVSKLKLSGATDDATVNGSLVVTPEEPGTPPSGGEQGGEKTPGAGSGNADSGSSTSGKVDKNGNEITEIPNAGAPIFVGAVAIILVAGAVLVIRNRK